MLVGLIEQAVGGFAGRGHALECRIPRRCVQVRRCIE
jgi:hypothetical protein